MIIYQMDSFYFSWFMMDPHLSSINSIHHPSSMISMTYFTSHFSKRPTWIQNQPTHGPLATWPYRVGGIHSPSWMGRRSELLRVSQSHAGYICGGRGYSCHLFISKKIAVYSLALLVKIWWYYIPVTPRLPSCCEILDRCLNATSCKSSWIYKTKLDI